MKINELITKLERLDAITTMSVDVKAVKPALIADEDERLYFDVIDVAIQEHWDCDPTVVIILEEAS